MNTNTGLCKLFYPNTLQSIFGSVFGMQRKIMQPYLLVIIVVLALVIQSVSAQRWDNVKITSVSAPSSIRAGQSLTVRVTVGYTLQFMAPESLVVGIREHTEIGNFYPLTAVSSNCHLSLNQQLCFADTSGYSSWGGVENLNVSLTLNAPNAAGSWQPTVIVDIMRIDFQWSQYETGSIRLQRLGYQRHVRRRWRKSCMCQVQLPSSGLVWVKLGCGTFHEKAVMRLYREGQGTNAVT